jgi:arginase family enzyme
VATSPWSDAATSSSPRTATPLSHSRTYSIYPGEALDPVAIPATANAVLDRVARADLAGFWIHVDCDVLNPDVMPATGALEPGGPTGEELGTFLITLASHPKALGLALTLYDPSLDVDGASAMLLVELLAVATPPDPRLRRPTDRLSAP